MKSLFCSLMDYYSLSVGLVWIQNGFGTRLVNPGMVSVGYQSFLVNPSLLCLHQFCVVMSEYLTVFHLNIV